MGVRNAAELPSRVAAWRSAGASEDFRDYAIHTHVRAGSDPVLVFLHGFPSSSYDFRLLLDQQPQNAALAFDFLGFGLSEKPREHLYSLFWQADLAEELVRRHFEGRPLFLVAHDMGTSVATELLARELERGTAPGFAGALLFNGSIVLERASLTPAQRLLRSPLGGLAARLSSERFFRQQFGSLFSAAHPLGREEAADQWALICAGAGRTLGHRLIHYLDERVTHAERWHGAISEWPGELGFTWGMLDPVATVAVLDALRALRPGAAVEELAELGHYPQLEDPARVAAALRAALERAA